MAPLTCLFILVLAFATATLSGILGMAGGLVLMGGLALVLPVSAAYVTHGLMQLVANGWRATLHRKHLRWDIVGWYALAALAAAGAVALISVTPSKPVLYLALGLTPMLTWLPRRWIHLDASRPRDAALAGLITTGLNLTSGVAGVALDIFFVRTTLTRHAIVATKAATVTLAHLAKIVVYGTPLIAAGGEALPPWWVFALGVPLSMCGAVAGGWVLDRMDDAMFKRLTRWIVTGIGVVYLIQAAHLFWRGA